MRAGSMKAIAEHTESVWNTVRKPPCCKKRGIPVLPALNIPIECNKQFRLTKMPDDLDDVEQQFLARLAEHQHLLEQDPEYRRRWVETKSGEQQPIFPVGAW